MHYLNSYTIVLVLYDCLSKTQLYSILLIFFCLCYIFFEFHIFLHALYKSFMTLLPSKHQTLSAMDNIKKTPTLFIMCDIIFFCNHIVLLGFIKKIIALFHESHHSQSVIRRFDCVLFNYFFNNSK